MKLFSLSSLGLICMRDALQTPILPPSPLTLRTSPPSPLTHRSPHPSSLIPHTSLFNTHCSLTSPYPAPTHRPLTHAPPHPSPPSPSPRASSPYPPIAPFTHCPAPPSPAHLDLTPHTLLHLSLRPLTPRALIPPSRGYKISPMTNLTP